METILEILAALALMKVQLAMELIVLDMKKKHGR